ncbi:MAG: zinc ribbon domain-containing protein [Kiritimatiellia bacterium]
MPIYEYQCDKCGRRFDFLAKKISERPVKCPACGSKKLTKAFSAFSTGEKSSSGSACSTGSCCSGSCGFE